MSTLAKYRLLLGPQVTASVNASVNTSVDISHPRVLGASSYVYYENGSVITLTMTGTDTLVGSRTGRTNGQSYQYQVAAVDSAGREGPKSSAATVNIPAVGGLQAVLFHFDDFADSYMHMAPPLSGSPLPVSYYAPDSALQRWTESADLNASIDAPVYVDHTPGSPASPARLAKVQLTFDRGGNPALKIERNEIVLKAFSHGGTQYSADTLLGHEYWLGRAVYLPASWIGTDVYEILTQGKTSLAGLGLPTGVSAGPWITISVDYGYKWTDARDPLHPELPARTSWAWRLRVSGQRARTGFLPSGQQSVKSTEVSGLTNPALRLDAWIGRWVKIVIRVIPGWADAGAACQIWLDGALMLSAINHTNVSENLSGYGHTWKQGLYSGWGSTDASGVPNYVPGAGRPTERVHFLRHWKMVEVIGRQGPLSAVTNADIGFTAVNPPDV